MLTSDYKVVMDDVHIKGGILYTSYGKSKWVTIAKRLTNEFHPITRREKIKIVLHSGTVIICG